MNTHQFQHFAIYTFITAILIHSTHTLSTPFGQTSKNVATQILQGAGSSLVDLNQYNLQSIDQIQKEWTANLKQKVSENQAYTQLSVKSSQELFVDTVIVSFPRLEGFGLGIELQEIAGGREDGLGITLISGVVANGPSDDNDIRKGDSISKISIVRKEKRGNDSDFAETQETFTINTECLSFDATVQAIQTLPSPNHDKYTDYYNLELKRIRKKPKCTVKLQYPPCQNEPDTTIEMFAGENLRQGMLIRGVKLNDPLAQRFDTKNGGNCGAGGLCRTCAVSIINGNDLLNPQRVAEKQMLEDNPRWRLACKAIVGFGMKEGNMTIQVNPRQWNQ